MSRLAPWVIFWLIVFGVIYIFAMKSNGAVDQPLLVDSSQPTGDEAKANMLVSPCPLTPKNLPLADERSA